MARAADRIVRCTWRELLRGRQMGDPVFVGAQGIAGAALVGTNHITVHTHTWVTDLTHRRRQTCGVAKPEGVRRRVRVTTVHACRE